MFHYIQAARYSSYEGLHAKVLYMIADIKSGSFLTPDMASLKRCQTLHRISLSWEQPIPCMASYFNAVAMSGVKKLSNLMPVINYQTLASNPKPFIHNTSTGRSAN